ncbi:MAG: C10 family peptidase, partial [Bacteroidales bacterium]|nr:C10 family peptidase [Bacteroidales bacterium]
MPLYGQAPDKETVYRVVNVNMNTRFPGGAREIEKLDTLFYNNEPDLFVVNLAGGGWILVSGDKKAVPVLGYNYEGQFFTGERNVNIASSLWLTSYAEQIKDLRKTKGLPVHDGWNADAKNDNWGEEKKLDIDPLIKAEWNQGAGWNRFCPEDSEGPGGRTYVGCVAVALAQALSVYAVPDTGTGSKLYYPEHYGMPEEYGVIEARFNETHYKWDSMSMDVADDYNALLLFHCAVSVTMKFGPNGSSARTSDTRLAMMDYFKMSRQSYYWIRSYHEDEWVETIINDLKMGRPLIYAGNAGDGTSGHAFNIDGVKPGNYFHLNWGWGGSR